MPVFDSVRSMIDYTNFKQNYHNFFSFMTF